MRVAGHFMECCLLAAACIVQTGVATAAEELTLWNLPQGILTPHLTHPTCIGDGSLLLVLERSRGTDPGRCGGQLAQ
jgi:hypothetical protein